MLSWEFSVLDFIQAHLRSGFGDTVMPFITHLGDGGAIWIVLTLALLIHPKTRRAGAALYCPCHRRHLLQRHFEALCSPRPSLRCQYGGTTAGAPAR